MKKITILITNNQYKDLAERSKEVEMNMSEQIRRAIAKDLIYENKDERFIEIIDKLEMIESTIIDLGDHV